MKRQVTLFAFITALYSIILPSFTHAQPDLLLNWAYAMNSSPLGGNIYGQSIKVDEAGNMYVTGYFQNTADFDPGSGTVNLVSAGNADIFLAKYDASGNYVYAKRMGGLSEDIGYSVAIDGSGNAYITGYFGGISDFDPGSSTANLTSAGVSDIFLAKYDASGNYVYAKQMGGTNYDYGYSLAIDSNGNAYITGYFFGTADFDPGSSTANLVSTGNYDIFLAKYDATGGYVYAKQMGGTNVDYGYSVAIDGGGNAYVTGYFWGTADFDPGISTANLTSAGQFDIFLAKYDASGNYVYAKRMGGIFDDYVNSVAIDGSGNAYLTGSFSGTADFDPGAGTANLVSAGGYDIFLAKYDAAGNYVYAKKMGGTFDDRGWSVAIDGSGNAYLTGHFSETADFDPGSGTANLISAGSYDIFLAKYDAAGNYVYAKRMGGTSSDRGYSVAIDAGGNAYITGFFQGTAYFDPGSNTVNLVAGSGATNCFIGKYDGFGNYTWAGAMGGYPSAQYDDYGKSIARDNAGNVYITGYFSGTADFDPGSGTVNLVSAGGYDIFLAKYDAAGNYVYAKKMGGTDYDYGHSVAIDAGGNAYITGFFQGTADFDPGSGTVNLVSAGGYDIFLAKYDAAGNYVYAKRMGGTSDDRGRSLAIDGSGNAYVTGFFSGTADFDPGPGTANLISTGSYDIFLTKYDNSGNYVYAKRMGGAGWEEGFSVAIDGAGNAYITGYFRETADFDPGSGTANLVSAGSDEIFLAKYNASGNYIYAKRMGGASEDYGISLAIDGSGNSYITGHFRGTADFDPGAGTANLISAGGDDVFLAKYDASGNYVYANRMGGTSEDHGLSVAIDGSGNACITGYFNGTADFDPGSGTVNLVSAGGADIFLAKHDASGNYVYAKGIGGTSNDQGYSMAIDGSGNAYLTGYFSGIADFDPGSLTYNLTSLNSLDIFVARYTEAGTISTGTINSPLCSGAEVTVPFTVTGTFNSGNVFTAQLSDAAGSFASPVDIGTLASTNSGSITATIPANTPAGTGYRIRVTGSDPVVEGSDNGSDLIINTPPTFTACPTDISIDTETGNCSAAVSYTVTATGTPSPNLTYTFSGNTEASGSGSGSGSTFNTGVTNITITAINTCGSVTCEFTVTVTDNQPPTISCAPDVTINTTPGLCTGTTTLTPPTITDNCSNIGNVLNFDGSNDYVTIPNSVSTATAFTFEAWVYCNSTAYWQRILDFGNTAGQNIFLTPFNSINGRPRFVINIGVGEQILDASVVLPIGSWQHIAVTLGASTAKIYINGVLSGTNNSFTYTPASLGSTLYNWIGKSQYYDPYFDGAIDEVRIWNVERTQTQVQANMNKELNAQPGLVSLYHFNQGIAGGNNAGITTATDASGNGFNGTLMNFGLNGATSNWIAGTMTLNSITLTSNAPSTYPTGNTIVTWTATDANSNTATCDQTVTVIDNQAPVLTCPGNQEVMADCITGLYTVTGIGFDPISAWDNCGNVTSVTNDYNGLGTLEGETFGPGTTTVTWTALDDAIPPNTSSCSFDVTVHQYSISGTLKYNNAAKTPLNNVELTISPSGANPTSTTDGNGNYSFTGLCPGDYTISVTNINKPVGYINSTDASMVNAWNANQVAIEHVKWMAGDVNLSYTAQSTDAKAIQNWFVYQGNPLYAFDRGEWAFYLAGDPVVGNSDPNRLNDAITVTVDGPETVNLYGQAVGDFNGSFIPGGLKAASDNLSLVYGETRLAAAAAEVELPVRIINSEILGAASLIMNYPSELFEVTGVELKLENGNLDWYAKGGELRVGWNTLNPQWLDAGSVWLVIYGRTTETFGTGDEIRFTLAPDPLNELADGNAQVIPDAKLGINVLAFSTTGTPENVQGTMYNEQCKLSSRPNPFSGYSIVDFRLPVDGHVTLTISDMLGRRVALLLDERMTAGEHSLKLDATPLQPGVYMATLKCGDLVKSIKLVRE